MAQDLSETHAADRRWDALGNLNVLPDDFICSILESLSPRDICRLACVSSVMYIFCNEEPLWMTLCLKRAKGQLQYKGSWKQTTLHLEKIPNGYNEYHRKLHFDGFNSIFLYRRLYRCYTQLDGFSFDNGNVERREGLSLDQFQQEFDGKKPVLLDGLADTWPAKSTWTVDQLLLKHGEKSFRISQMNCGKIKMSLKDYVSYIQHQHDEDPLYIFDEKFGEVAPDLLNDYSVPHLFQEDFFDVLDREQRPPYRWLIIGPERSGASWHTDPSLTSAWNTLLFGHKRWALYPPGKVPMGVTVHVDEEGDVNVDTPSSLQWWLDYYPLLADDDKPIECTQLPGETIFVPSGWWHCVLNLDTTIAVTQNFVNPKNFEFVCLDMAPGYRHKGVCRAGFLALDGDAIEDAKKNYANGLSCLDRSQTIGAKRFKTEEPVGESHYVNSSNGASKIHSLWKQEFSYDINFLATFLDKDRDHYNARWSPNNSIGQRELREWLCKLWAEKPDVRELLWKGACLALNADKWSQCLAEIRVFYNLPSVADDDMLPVGTGSNPVYLVADNVVKIFVEDGLDACMHSLGAELEFYNQLHDHNSPLKSHIPAVLASGIVFLENGCYRICEWDGKRVPDVISKCNLTTELCTGDYNFGVWSKLLFEYRKDGRSFTESVGSSGCSNVYPFIITKRCKGKILAQLGDTLSEDALQSLASFLGEQLRNLHILPYPSLNNLRTGDLEGKMNVPLVNGSGEALIERDALPPEWELFIRTLNRRKKDLSSRLTEWGNPIPEQLVEKIDNYIPDNFEKLLDISKENGIKASKHYSWIHKDIMVDNIYMEPCSDQSAGLVNMDSAESYHDEAEIKTWRPSYLLDFSNISVGDPLWELIPLHLDVFKGNSRLLKQFLQSYKLPFLKRITDQKEPKPDSKFGRLSYHAMCYCILHEDNVISAIFGLWKELETANSWEDIEETVWGELNNYVASC